MEKPIQISADEVVQLQNEKLIKYTNLAQGESDAVEATQIGLIDKSLDVYSVANLRDEKLFFTGGGGGRGNPASDRVIEFDLKTLTARDLPRMNEGREQHNSCILNRKLYVFGGLKMKRENNRTSVEVLDLDNPQQWELLCDHPHLGRNTFVVSPIGPRSIFISSGYLNGQERSDALIFDVISKSIT